MPAMREETVRRYALENNLRALGKNWLGKVRIKEKVMPKTWILGLDI